MSSGDYGQDGAGRVLAGRYRVVRQLGRGGMGVVCLAVDEVLGREVAVKELRTFTDASGPDLAELRLRMQREARAAARVRHPGVIAVHDVADDGGRPVIVMELVDGPSLDDVLRERGTLDPREAAGIGAKVMDALDAAHGAGVLHRDVKPGNILLDRSGRIVLTDFGIAAVEDPGRETTKLTRTGDIVGSLDYLAPERAQGRAPGPPSDVWALGATLYAAVEGGSPFRRTSTWSTLSAIVTEPLPEPRRAGPLTPVLRALMDKDPQARPDARQAREMLEEVAAGGSAAASGAVPRVPTTLDNPGFGPAPDLSQPSPVPHPAPGSPPAPEGPGAPSAGNPGGPFPGGAAPGDGYHGAPAAGAFGAPGAAGGSPAAPGPDSPLVSTRAQRRSAGRRSGRTAVAVAAAIAVLAGAGTTVFLLTRDDGKPAGAAAAASSPTPTGGEKAEPGKDGKEKSRDPEKTPASESAEDDPAEDGAKATGGGDGGANGGRDEGKDDGGSGGSDGGSTGGSGGATGGSGGGEPAPAPVCHPIGGGKFNCEVWRTADSYSGAGAPGQKVGTLNAGTNYFYCQVQGSRETYGKWTNVWWGRTDDDSGNANVYVSAVYVKGGDNDQPLPGLPVC